MADISQPNGTLLTRKFGANQDVTSTAMSKKHGYLVLIGATVLDHEDVIAFYGRLTRRGRSDGRAGSATG